MKLQRVGVSESIAHDAGALEGGGNAGRHIVRHRGIAMRGEFEGLRRGPAARCRCCVPSVHGRSLIGTPRCQLLFSPSHPFSSLRLSESVTASQYTFSARTFCPLRENFMFAGLVGLSNSLTPRLARASPETGLQSAIND